MLGTYYALAYFLNNEVVILYGNVLNFVSILSRQTKIWKSGVMYNIINCKHNNEHTYTNI